MPVHTPDWTYRVNQDFPQLDWEITKATKGFGSCRAIIGEGLFALELCYAALSPEDWENVKHTHSHIHHQATNQELAKIGKFQNSYTLSSKTFPGFFSRGFDTADQVWKEVDRFVEHIEYLKAQYASNPIPRL